MRAVTHISVPVAPDDAFPVAAQFQILTATGLLGAVVGLVVLLGALAMPAVAGSVLLGFGMVSALAIGTATGSRRRERARRQMLEAVAGRGDERVFDVSNGFLVNELGERLTDGRAVGIDLWKSDAGHQAPDVARSDAELEGVADRVEIRNGDARSMPFDDVAPLSSSATRRVSSSGLAEVERSGRITALVAAPYPPVARSLSIRCVA
jgi:hypothetical protein